MCKSDQNTLKSVMESLKQTSMKVLSLQNILFTFFVLATLSAIAAVVSFLLSCRDYRDGVDLDRNGNVICRVAYPLQEGKIEDSGLGDTVRIVVVVLFFTLVFGVIGVCCCYKLTLMEEKRRELEDCLKPESIPLDVEVQSDKMMEPTCSSDVGQVWSK